MTALKVAMSFFFWLPNHVAVSTFIICRGLCACTQMLWICVLYVSFGSTVRTRTFGCIAMGSAVFILRFRLLLYSKAGLMTALKVAMSFSFWLPNHVAVSTFIICRGLCACTQMLWICVLYVSFGSTVRTRTFGCIAMGSAVFILRFRLLLYSTGSGVNTVHVVLPGFSVRWLYFDPAKTLYGYGCKYFFAALTVVYVDVMVMLLLWCHLHRPVILKLRFDSVPRESLKTFKITSVLKR